MAVIVHLVKPRPSPLPGHSDRGGECRGRVICAGQEGGAVPCLSAVFEEGAESGRLGTGESQLRVFASVIFPVERVGRNS